MRYVLFNIFATTPFFFLHRLEYHSKDKNNCFHSFQLFKLNIHIYSMGHRLRIILKIIANRYLILMRYNKMRLWLRMVNKLMYSKVSIRYYDNMFICWHVEYSNIYETSRLYVDFFFPLAFLFSWKLRILWNNFLSVGNYRKNYKWWNFLKFSRMENGKFQTIIC